VANTLRSHWPTLLVCLIAYALPFLWLQSAGASAVRCTSVSFTCISEGAPPATTRLYAGQITTTENRDGVQGGISATGTSLIAPTENGFIHWYGITDLTPPPGHSVSREQIQAGIGNGIYNGNASYPQTSDYNWYSEVINWCNGWYWVGAGGYTPGSNNEITVDQGLSSYDCGSGGAVTVYDFKTFFNNQLAVTGWLLTLHGHNCRVDANTEFYPFSWLESAGTICYGQAGPFGGCNQNTANTVQRAYIFWSNWDSSDTSVLSQTGYKRTNIQTNFRFKVTSTY